MSCGCNNCNGYNNYSCQGTCAVNQCGCANCNCNNGNWLEWIFSEEDRAMLRRKLLDHITIEKLAEEFNFSVQHTSRKYNKAKNELFSHLK